MIRFIRRNLTVKILIAFSVAVLIGIGGVAVLANVSTRSEFETYLSFDQPIVAQRLAGAAAETYRRSGSWEAVARAVAELTRPIFRVVIADVDGQVVVDTGRGWIGRSTTSLSLGNGTLVGDGSHVYGTLYLVPLARSGNGPRPFNRPLRLTSTTPDPRLSQAETTFLARVNQSVIVAALGGIVAALIIGGLLARQIILPLGDVTRAAQRIARGHLDERIDVGDEDEVGRLARAFNQMAESLQRTEEARRHLVADVAHELRTPLTVIGGTVQAMRDGILPADDAGLQTIQEEVSALTRLVSDLRDLSLDDVGQFTVRRERIDLRRVLEQVANSFAAATTTRNINLAVELPEAPLCLQGDEARLRQCFHNLVDNALRHTSAGGTITITARPGPSIVVTVRDTGQGISGEDLPRVFERFYRADPSRARRSGGSGLGLAIVQQIVRAHGGAVSAESAGLGKGAAFRIVLPAETASRVAARAAGATA